MLVDKKKMEEQITDLTTLRGVSEAFAQISSTRMQSVRGGVLSSREFLDSLKGVFDDVRGSYRGEVIRLIKKKKLKKGERLTMLAHNGKTVVVFLAANTGLYGDIIQRTFELFLQEVRENPTSEATIVGKLGQSLFLAVEPKRPYTFFEYPDYGRDEVMLGKLIAHLVQYEKIRVYHGRFRNVVNQEPQVYEISAQTPVAGEEIKEEAGAKQYIFEPSLERILQFFEKEMFSSLLDQTVHESQLAKFASRMLAMDTASQKIKENLDKTKAEKLKLMHELSNKKQQSSLVSVLALNSS